MLIWLANQVGILCQAGRSGVDSGPSSIISDRIGHQHQNKRVTSRRYRGISNNKNSSKQTHTDDHYLRENARIAMLLGARLTAIAVSPLHGQRVAHDTEPRPSYHPPMSACTTNVSLVLSSTRGVTSQPEIIIVPRTFPFFFFGASSVSTD